MRCENIEQFLDMSNAAHIPDMDMSGMRAASGGKNAPANHNLSGNDRTHAMQSTISFLVSIDARSNLPLLLTFATRTASSYQNVVEGSRNAT